MKGGFARTTLFCSMALLASGIARAEEPRPIMEGELLRLPDEPQVVFHRSGWGWTTTTNPVFLTPDNMTNAMIAIFREKKGTTYPSGLEVPKGLDSDSVQSFLEAWVQKKPTEKISGLEFSREEIGDRPTVRARYFEDGKPRSLLAFAFDDYLVLLVLAAKDDTYFKRGLEAAREVIVTISTATTLTCSDCASSGGTLDQASGLCLPGPPPGFTAAAQSSSMIFRLANFRHSVSVGYDSSDPRISITMFAYDRDESKKENDRLELKAAVDEILSAHLGAKMIRAFSEPAHRFDRYVEINLAEFKWEENDAPFISGLWIVPVGNRQIKVRATMPVSGMPEAQARRLAASHVKALLDRVCKTR